MTLKEKAAVLDQLRPLRREVDMLSQRIAELELAARGGAGRVSGLPGAVARWGGKGNVPAKLAAMAERLDERRSRCMDVLGALYDFIDGVEDSRMRLILTCRYVDGDTWQRVAFRIGESDEQYPRRLHNRFLEGLDMEGCGLAKMTERPREGARAPEDDRAG